MTVMTGTHMQWGTAMGISMNIGKPLTTHLVSKEALSGTGLTRLRISLEYFRNALNDRHFIAHSLIFLFIFHNLIFFFFLFLFSSSIEVLRHTMLSSMCLSDAYCIYRVNKINLTDPK